MLMVWPEKGEALDRTIAAERAIEDLYAEALGRWAPAAQAAALPTMAGQVYNGDPSQVVLPPDPAAVAQTSPQWSTTTEAVIIAGVGLLWAAAVLEAMDALGIPLPDVDRSEASAAVLDTFDPAVLRIVDRAVGGMDRDELHTAAGIVELAAPLREARATVLDQQREVAAQTLAVVQDKVTQAVAAVTAAPDAPPAAAFGPQRAAADASLSPAGQDFRDVARNAGYQAAGTLNHAVITAARQANEEFGEEELEKVWIATLDGKTRPTHWAADGQRVPLESRFTVGGEQMFVPGDEAASPAEWKNCRCRVGVLAVGEDLPDEVDRHTERLDGRDSVAINRDGRTQTEEIERRRDAGNIRARDDEDGIGRVASSGWAAPSEQEHDMKPSDLAAKTATLAADVDQDTNAETFLTFSGVIGKLGVATSDRRILAPDIELSFREFPLPVGWCKQTSGGHMDSFTVGVVEDAKIDGSDVIVPSGYFLNSTEAVEAADQVNHKVSAPSLDLAAAEYVFTDENGTEIEGDLYDWWEENGEPFTYFTKAEVTGFTLVQTPAFDGIDITLGERETRDLAVVAAVVASVDGPRLKAYDPAMFADPKLTRPTAPTMDNKTGRIYGHLAEWGHAIRGGNGDLAPRNHNGYANFHTSQVQLTDGKQLSVGRLTVEGGHADTTPGITVATARAHYDNVCTAYGLVRVGEDRFGIWFSGVPAPGVDPEVFQAGMTAPLSGDWRDCGLGLDMIAAHAVNSPGFPIYSALTGPNGQDVALVASLGPSRKSTNSGDGFTLDRESLKTLLAEVVETVDRRRADHDAALAHKARAQAALAKARETVGDPPPEPTPSERVAQLLAEAHI